MLASVYSTGASLARPRGVDPVAVRSEPCGATVIVDGRIEGTTPVLLYLSTSVAHTIRLEHLGYTAAEAVVEPSLRWSLLARFLLGHPAAGVVQTGVDAARGHVRKLSPGTVHLYLQQCSELQAELMPRVVSQLL